MKTPSSDLYDLIHSLSKSEKRYIQLHSAAETLDYMELWKILLKEENYNEPKLKTEYVDANFMKNFAMSKQYLFERILLLLDRFRKQSDADVLTGKGRLIKILWEKGFKKQAENRLKKVLKKAEEGELFEVQLFLLEIKKIFPEADYTETAEEIKACLSKLQNINEYWEISRAIYQKQQELRKQRTYIKEQELSTLFNTPKLFNDSFTKTFRSRVYYYHARTTYFFATDQKESAYSGNRTFLKLLEDHPKQLIMMPERYLSILNNLLIDSLALHKEEEFIEGLEKLRSLPSQKAFKSIQDIDARVFRQGMLLEVNNLLGKKKYAEAEKLISPLQVGLDKYGDKIASIHLTILEYLATYLLFLNERHEEALDGINEILKKENDGEIFQFVLILELLTHFSLNNNELVESLLISVRRRLQSRRDLYETEISLFKFIRSYLNAAAWGIQKDLTLKFKTEIANLKMNPTQKRFFNFIDLEEWVESFLK
ncbi:MAG: hypothetical protein ACI85O_001934 [Saprospiraceae bacterium]